MVPCFLSALCQSPSHFGDRPLQFKTYPVGTDRFTGRISRGPRVSNTRVYPGFGFSNIGAIKAVKPVFATFRLFYGLLVTQQLRRPRTNRRAQASVAEHKHCGEASCKSENQNGPGERPFRV